MKKYFPALIWAIIAIASCEKKEQEIPVSSVSLNKTSVEMVEGESYQLSATVSPSDATNKTVLWASSNPSVATVDNGKISAIAEGSSTITASCSGKSATCQVTVIHKVVPVSSIQLSEKELYLTVGESKELTVTTIPSNADEKAVVWSSSNESVVIVKDGLVNTVREGTAVIKAAVGDVTAACNVTVILGEQTTSEIRYKTINGTILILDAKWDEMENNSIISHTMANELGIIKFANEVKSIPQSAFFSQEELIDISLPNVLDSIPNRAFQGCANLESFDASNSISSIGSNAFSNCEKLSNITIGNNVTKIGSSAFYGCKQIKQIIIPDNVTSIGEFVFCGCSGAEYISIGTGIQFLPAAIFRGCESLTSLKLSNGSVKTDFYTFDGCSSVERLIFGNGSETVECNLLGGIMPFGFPSLKEIILEEGIKSIGEQMFYNMEFSSVSLPITLEEINKGAFSACKNLADISLPSGLRHIGESAFTACQSLTSIIIPNGITELSDFLFNNCKSLKQVSLPSSLKKIGFGALGGCESLEMIDIPKEVESIETSAFQMCSNLTQIELPETLTVISELCFSLCSSLNSIVIPANVCTIERCAFMDCTSLVSIVIPQKVTEIQEGAFSNCSTLESIFLQPIQPPKLSGDKNYRPFRETNNCPIYVPGESVDAYKTDSEWVIYSDRIHANPLVDLGLSVKWASYNVGASKPEEHGGFYAWGEIESKEYYSWNYKWAQDDHKGFTKYNVKQGYGTVDNLTRLELEDDVAHVRMGGRWRMPTENEVCELIDNCSIEYIKNFNNTGRQGFKFTSRVAGHTDKWIFFPITGAIAFDKVSGKDYWMTIQTADLDVDEPFSQIYLSCDKTNSSPYYKIAIEKGDTGMGRLAGHQVRGVYAY